MQKTNLQTDKILFYFSLSLSLIISGIGIGWLVGLSASPVVSVLITSICGSVAAIVAAASGLVKSESWKVNPLPVAIFIVGLVAGAKYGIEARTSNRFGLDTRVEVQRWKDAGLELAPKDIIKRIFEYEYPLEGATKGGTVDVTKQGVLSSSSSSACSTLYNKQGADLRDFLAVSPIVEWRSLPKIVADDKTLERIVQEVLCIDGN